MYPEDHLLIRQDWTKHLSRFTHLLTQIPQKWLSSPEQKELHNSGQQKGGVYWALPCPSLGSLAVPDGPSFL